jgi:hypothetical protein|eukprot:COSAG01_NODE_3299_length_6296_cov_243.565112_4_plen_93_part_00
MDARTATFVRIGLCKAKWKISPPEGDGWDDWVSCLRDSRCGREVSHRQMLDDDRYNAIKLCCVVRRGLDASSDGDWMHDNNKKDWRRLCRCV